jgi:hypothetical protein
MISALLFVVQSATAGPGADRAVLDAFREVCWAVPRVGEIVDGALAHGWTAVRRGQDERADRLQADMESAASDGYRVTVRMFARAVGGRRLLLSISRGELTAPAAEGFGSTNCQIRELGEARPLSASSVETWLGRPADEVEQDEAGSFSQWYSYRPQEPTIVTVAYFAPGSYLAGQAMMPGIYLNAERHGDHHDVDPR